MRRDTDRSFTFNERRQLSIRTHNETFSVARDRVYEPAGSLMETREHKDDFKDFHEVKDGGGI
jgi:hypothetical protein